MALKITQGAPAANATTLRLEGRVTGSFVDEVRRACDEVLERGERLVLEVTDVAFADAAGVALLRRLRDCGARLDGLAPFIAIQLNGGRYDDRQ